MKQETCSLLIEAASEIGAELEERTDYSGRCMYGSSTHAVIGSHSALIRAVAQAAYALGEKCATDMEGKFDDIRDTFLDDIGRVRQDNMGRYDLVFY